jgi:phosphoglycerate mutase 1 family
VAKTIFYDATAIDRTQLTELMSDSDHELIFESASLNERNIHEDAEVVSTFVSSKIDNSLFDKMPRLRLIATRSTGFDHLDLMYLNGRGIKVVNVPTYGNNTVAEHTFALLLSLTKKLPLVTSMVERQGLAVNPRYTGMDLKDKTIGIIGFGHIGKCVAKIAYGFGMKILANNRRVDQEFIDNYNVEFLPTEEIFQKADIISLHCPLDKDNYHLINDQTIATFKQGAILINTARGELVENHALLKALRSGHLAGVGLDVLEGEKYLSMEKTRALLLEDDFKIEATKRAAEIYVLQKMPNVIITPHNAFNTVEAVRRINQTTASNIKDFWYGNIYNEVKPAPSFISGKLILLRHGESQWNKLNKWTGRTDIHITEEGWNKSLEIGKKLESLNIKKVYTSTLSRTKETYKAIKESAHLENIPMVSAPALDERDYGAYTGMNRDVVKASIGEKAFKKLRRSWDGKIEGGETLKMVYERVIPYYLRIILPQLIAGENVLIVGHGNVLRALIKYLKSYSNEQILDLNVESNIAFIYNVDKDGKVLKESNIPV